MGKLWISEYTVVPTQGVMTVQCAKEPALVVQPALTYSTHAESVAFNPKTNFIRIHTDSICSFKIGNEPVATTDDARMVAGQTELVGVTGGDKLSVIVNT